MATLIDWSQLQARISAYKAQHGHETDHLALTHIVLEHDLGLEPEDVTDAVTDGPDDRGIDAACLEEREDSTTIHLYQVKHVTTFEKSADNFPSNEIDKMLSYIADLLAKDHSLKNTTNPLLWGKTQAIWAAYDRGTPSIAVHFCGNMARLIDSQRDRIVEALRRYGIAFHEHTLSSITASLIESKKSRIDRRLQLVDNQYFERVDGNIRGLVATIAAVSLIELIRDPEKPDSVLQSIFDDNVRVWLTLKNPINKKIVESALSPDNREFWYLNNGITMTCDALRYPQGFRSPSVDLTNVQIVNGGQTSNALFEAHSRQPDGLRNVLLLVRIYETKEREISQLIAETTNSQTPIRTRDLRANDDVQKKLEDSFKHLGYGYFYERKRDQHKDQDRAYRIDAQAAGQAYVAYYMNLPEIGKKEKKRLFGDLYDMVFDESSITAERLLTPVLIHRAIDEQKKELQRAIKNGEPFHEDSLVLIDGAYHVLNAVHSILEAGGLDENDARTGIGVINDATSIVASVASTEEQLDAAFSHSRFFKDSKTTQKIHDKVRASV